MGILVHSYQFADKQQGNAPTKASEGLWSEIIDQNHVVDKYDVQWPTPQQVEAENKKRKRPEGWQADEDDHLLVGCSVAMAIDFLTATDFFKSYKRSKEDQSRNGPLNDNNDAIGYDVATHIRTVMEEKGLQAFSAVEAMNGAGYPKGEKETISLQKYYSPEGYAMAFLSHAQAEQIWQTLVMEFWAAHTVLGYSTSEAHCDCFKIPVFLDYFCLRQCVSDFDPPQVKRVIKTIGFTFAGVSPPNNDMLKRVWCAYEVYCTIVDSVKFWALTPNRKANLPAITNNVDLRKCEASKESDRKHLMEWFEQVPGGIEVANAAITDAFQTVQKMTKRSRRFFAMIFLGLVPVIGFAMATVIVGSNLNDEEAQTTDVKILLKKSHPVTLVVGALTVLSVLAWVVSFIAFYAMGKVMKAGTIIDPKKAMKGMAANDPEKANL
jgi:hypothetical protein